MLIDTDTKIDIKSGNIIPRFSIWRIKLFIWNYSNTSIYFYFTLGDISKSNELVISIAAVGEVDKPVTRAGAKIGDKVKFFAPNGREREIEILEVKNFAG